jgi:hypothetical protein
MIDAMVAAAIAARVPSVRVGRRAFECSVGFTMIRVFGWIAGVIVRHVACARLLLEQWGLFVIARYIPQPIRKRSTSTSSKL